MLIEQGKVYKTRDGSKAEILVVGMKSDDIFTVGAKLTNPAGLESLVSYTAEGKWYNGSENDDRDLVAEWKEPIKVSGWVNVYDYGVGKWFYETRESAEAVGNSAINTYIATIFVSGEQEID